MSSMLGSKNSFTNQYIQIEVIKNKKNKKTSIIRNLKGEYFIAKKFYSNDIYAMNEIALMRTIKHPNIVAFHDLISQKGRMILIQQYCEEGDLAYHIRRQIKKKRCFFSQKIIAKWTLQLLLALQYLHNKNIMHRDIRPENIFLTANGNIKLGCFRSSKLFDSQNNLSTTVIGSSYYMAPECVQNQGYTEKVDIWALGCLLYELCSLKQIFHNNNIIQQAKLILKEGKKQLSKMYSQQLQQVFNKCLINNSKQRITAKSLLRQKYFMNEMKKLISQKPQNSRVPIKHYNIHLNVLATKKQKDVSSLKQKYNTIIKQNQKMKSKEKEKHNNIILHLPKIQEFQKQKVSKRPNSKQIQRGKQLVNKEDSKKQHLRQKNRQKSIQVQRKKSIKKLNLQQQQQQESKKNKSVNKKNYSKEHKLKTQIGEESPKRLLAPPPLLPKPLQKKIDKKFIEKSKQEQQPINFSETMKKQQLSGQLLKVKNNEQLYSQQEIKSSLTKIFEDLGIKQEDEEEFSFQLQDQNMARLTIKGNEGGQLIQTYKTKLQQLIEQINEKYSPYLEPIQQRTQQFDSNTFANLRR